MERGLNPRLHLRFCGITVFQIDFRRFEFFEEDLIRGGRKKCSQRHLGSMLRQRSSLLLGHKIEELGIEGIDTVIEPKRSYPQGHLAAQVLGMVGDENTGLSGLEYSHEEQLGGDDGERRVVKDALGEPVSLIETDPAEPGEDLRLTLDSAIQERVEAVLAEVGQTYQPAGATALVMDPRSGAILALANWPRVDANNVVGSPAYASQNRAIQFNYEPGSTFKAFTVAAALEEGEVTPTTSFNVPPTITVADREIGEAHPVGYRTLNTREILSQSSNVGSAKLALDFEREPKRTVLSKRAAEGRTARPPRSPAQRRT
jgi:cell division protein FtsI (penicillin-binding protein 3)